MTLLPSHSSIPFASIYHYNSQQLSGTGRQLHDVVTALKQDGFVPHGGDKTRAIPLLVSVMAEKIPLEPSISKLFTNTTALIPMPGHSVEIGEKGNAGKGIRSTLLVCNELISKGLGNSLFNALKRTETVAKSSISPSDRRPKPSDHFRTLEVAERSLPIGINQLTIVDDVITRGATMIAAYHRLALGFPDIKINCFSLIRARNDIEVTSFTEITVGTIELNNDITVRKP